MAECYQRHRAEFTDLHRLVRENLDDFLALAGDETGTSLPRFVERAFRAYLACGLPSGGFTHLVCPSCGHEAVLAFSCKTRLLCPSCGARHATAAAARLMEVLPEVAYRHVVVSLPFEVRGLLAFRSEVLDATVRLVNDSVLAWQRARSGHAGDRVGAVSVLQRAGNSLNANPHLHLLLADGYWEKKEDGTLGFIPTRTPTLPEVAKLATTIAQRLVALLRRRKLLRSEDEEYLNPPPPLDAMGTCIQTALSLGLRAKDGKALEETDDEAAPPETDGSALCAVVQGVNVHVGAVVKPGDRRRLDQLLRYLLRPPLSLKRLSIREEDGMVLYRLAKPDRWGHTVLLLSPDGLLARLAAILPAPRFALRRLIGVFASGARDRRNVLKARPTPPDCGHEDRELLFEPTRSRSDYIPWRDLLRRAWDFDGLRCPRCQGWMQPVAVVEDPVEVEKLLRRLGLWEPLPKAAKGKARSAVA